MEMKRLVGSSKLALMTSVVLMMLLSASCWGNNIETTNNDKPASDEYPAYDFTEAVAKVTSMATELTIKSYRTGNLITLNKDNPGFNSIISYIEQATPTRNQPRFAENEGEMVEVTVLYSLSYFLNFKLSDGSEVLFDYGGDIWFNSKDMIYGASADSAMFELIEQMAGD